MEAFPNSCGGQFPLFQTLLVGVYRFVLRNIALGANITGTKLVEEYEYPEDAIREVVVNAVIHRDYSITQTYTQVNIFSNRLEVFNPGILPPGVNVENLKTSQFSRNKIITKIMKDLDFVEEYGRGINLIYSRMAAKGLAPPLFKNVSNVFKTILLGTASGKLSERQLSFWYFIQKNARLTRNKAHGLFPEVSRATIAGDLRKMVQVGLFVSKGSSVNTYYEASF